MLIRERIWPPYRLKAVHQVRLPCIFESIFTLELNLEIKLQINRHIASFHSFLTNRSLLFHRFFEMLYPRRNAFLNKFFVNIFASVFLAPLEKRYAMLLHAPFNKLLENEVSYFWLDLQYFVHEIIHVFATLFALLHILHMFFPLLNQNFSLSVLCLHSLHHSLLDFSQLLR